MPDDVYVARWIALPLLVLALLTGCGGSDYSSATEATTDETTTEETTTSTETESIAEEPTEDLGDFFTRRIKYEFLGQYGRSWDSLHPGQQAIVTRTRYEECREEVSDQVAGVDFQSLKVIETYEDPIDAAGVPEKTSTAVTVEVTVSDGNEEDTLTDTLHAVAVDGEWKWLLPPADVRAFKQGICPSS